MSPGNQKTIQEKLLRLRETIAVIEELRIKSKDEFLRDSIVSSAMMYNLIISIELIVDVGNHILAEAFQRSEKTYRDVVVALGSVGVVPKEFAEENEFMADFRNKMIHDYDRIDLDQAYELSQKAPEIFRRFAECFVAFLEKR